MNLDKLLNEVQQTQLSHFLTLLIARGFGVLEIRVEKGRIAWIYPHYRRYTPAGLPGYTPQHPQAIPTCDKPLAELLGDWQEPFAADLAEQLGSGFGTVAFWVQHGKIAFLESTPDIRARTGQTGQLRRTNMTNVTSH